MLMFCEKGRYIFSFPGMAVVAEPVNLRRPPNEAYSLILQATIGCPWNRCVFCGNYKRKKFLPRYPDIMEDIMIARDFFGWRPKSIFLSDANSIVLRSEWLLEIAEVCFNTFPNLERISTYGGARFIIKKNPEELKMLNEAGIKKLYLGLETGDDQLLKFMNKGANTEEMIKAAKMIADAGMELSVTVILGLGGKGSWERNAKLTAKVLNEMRPHETRIHNLVVHPDSPLYDKVRKGEVQEALPDEVLMETKELIRQIDVETEVYTYSSNYLRPGILDGKLQKDKDQMLNLLDFALNAPDRRIYLQDTRLI